MATKLRIFYPELAKVVGANEVEVEGTTVGECLGDLVNRYPEASPLLFEDDGDLQPRVYVCLLYTS
ncbi:MAG: hypothetical protein N2578_10150, partial [Bdellovibrionaceae bacterium]|nr:hypothetical protein [Pseudobdellovibrionaceae bacterium]